MNYQSTRAKPRCRVFNRPATVFTQAEASWVGLRLTWLTGYPALAAISPPPFKRRPEVLRASCRSTRKDMQVLTKSAVS